MERLIHCKKIGKELPGLDYQPLKGELGLRVFENISKEAWKLWLGHSTMVINEYRLNPSEPEAQKILKQQMEDFFFSEKTELPPDYIPPTSAS
jgi:Fe-S cluster biosynthesis and repair protein YggX